MLHMMMVRGTLHGITIEQEMIVLNVSIWIRTISKIPAHKMASYMVLVTKEHHA